MKALSIKILLGVLILLLLATTGCGRRRRHRRRRMMQNAVPTVVLAHQNAMDECALVLKSL